LFNLCFIIIGRPEPTEAALQAQIKRRTQHRLPTKSSFPAPSSRHSLSSRRVITMRMSGRAVQTANPSPPLVADTA